MPVKGITPGLLEIGKIKIGKKGQMIESAGGKEFRPPEKLDHFLITTNEKIDDDYVVDEGLINRLTDNLAATGAMVNAAGKLIGIPIRLLYNDTDLNFPTRYASYLAGKLACTGDGETARTSDGRDVPCPCERLDPGYPGKDKCKINGVLTCVIDGMDMFGGCHKFRTTSRNTCQSIIGSLELLKVATGGALSFLPLSLILQPKSTTTGSGQKVTVYIVSIVYRGTLEALQQSAIETARGRQQYLVTMKNIDETIEAPWCVDENDIVEEFYPEAVSPGQPVAPEDTANKEDGGENGQSESDTKALGAKTETPGEDSPGPGPEKTKKTATKKAAKKAKATQAPKEDQPASHNTTQDEPQGVVDTPDPHFGGKQAEIIDAYKKLIQWDREAWIKALASIGISMPHVEIDNICKSKKWAQEDVWTTVIARFKPDDVTAEDIEKTVKHTLKSIINIGRGKALWEGAMKEYNITSARFIQAADVDDFLRLLHDDIPF